MNCPHVLVVAGSDSSGGAGVARDIETVAALGGRSCLAITAITVQTHDAVAHVEPVAPGLVESQMRAALDANRVAAIKIGLLPSAPIIERVAGVLTENRHIPAVLDPVIAASSGRVLLAEGALQKMRDLMPLCALVTPNLPELAILANEEIVQDEAGIASQAMRLLEKGVPALLVKGGHASGAYATDILFEGSKLPQRFDAPRVQGTVRGTGCMVASVVAACLAQGTTLENSVREAKAYVLEMLRAQTR